MDVSIIVATYNRSKSLEVTLKSFCALNNPDRLTWELLVVDNNSSDDTAMAVKKFESQLPIRYIFEPRQGKSNALNRAISEANANLLLFTDDDVNVDPNWLTELARAFVKHPTAGFCGGKVIPVWERKPPRWLEENCRHPLLMGVTVCFDYGDEDLQWVRTIHFPFYGANLALRKDVLMRENVQFRADLGPGTGKEMRGEETFLEYQLEERGVEAFYAPKAIVYHRNRSSRMTERYVRDWHKAAGAAEVRLGLLHTIATKRLFGAPRWWWRCTLESAVVYALHRFRSPPSVWLEHECKMARRWGRICEVRQRVKEGKELLTANANNEVLF